MYSKGCGLVKVNEARLGLFTRGKKSLDTLPPTQAALYQHIHRVILQGTVWSQATSVHMDIPEFQTGAGKRTAVVGGCLSGLPSRTAAKSAQSSYSVDVAPGSASGAGLVCVAQVSANVKGPVSTTTKHDLLIEQCPDL